ncbi:MAG: PASTA domain-containing protein [Candidatus Cloacimonadales bacterium]|jgi:serine/threonine-protein kinase|nr:PASTA domain-containing protein [Candidatus Cloacimonadota bacterium]MDD2649918.1 PASTA domain-containing protein [Candidatus Cloacimonadota bacterium]MDX9976521.1 PASTA domain-containing protein [Candidatus Cloacimonadales bacterium]
MKFKAFIVSVIIFIIVFVLGLLIVNIAMNYLVKNKAEVDVPALVGLNYEEAKKICSNLKLYIAVSDYEYNELPEKYIVSQKPYSGKKIYEDRTISVTLSLGEKSFKIPDFSNVFKDDIEQLLRKNELEIDSLVYEYSDIIRKDYVIRTIPLAGEAAKSGASLTVIISKGKKSLFDLDDDAYPYDPSFDDYIY